MVFCSGICQRLNDFIQWKHRKWLALILAIVEMVAFSGYHYGFNALTSPYKSLKVFESLCNGTDCTGQNKMFGYAFTAWTVSQMCLITVAGIIMDRLGLRVLKLIAVTIYAIGTLLFGLANEQTGPILFPAGILVALGCTSSLICDHQISSMFPKMQGFAIALMSGAFDSSTVITFIISKTVPDITLQTSFIILAICAPVLGVFMALFILTQWTPQMAELGKSEKTLKGPEFDKNLEDQIGSEVEAGTTERIQDAVEKRYPSLKSCLLSIPFCLVTLWFMFGYLRFGYFLVQMEQQLNYMVGEEDTPRLLNLSSAIMMAGLLISPISGFVLDVSRAKFRSRLTKKLRNARYKLTSEKIYWAHIIAIAPAFLLMAISALAFSLIIFIRHEVAFYAVVICVVILRSLLFTALINFLLTAFPLRYFGTINGVVNTIGGLFSLLQNALIELRPEVGNGIALIGACILFITPVTIFIKGR